MAYTVANNVLVEDDPLYEELYDVRREAMEAGNFVEEDMNPKMGALRDRGGVQQGTLRELLGLAPLRRHALSHGLPAFTALSWEACDEAFRNNRQFSSTMSSHPNPGKEETMGILEMDGDRHKTFRRTLQPMFLKPRTLGWWRERWIGDITETLIERLTRQDRAELNIELCARVPVHTVTRGVGLEGNDSLLFRNALLRSQAARPIPAEERQAAAETVERMLLDLVAKRRVEPGDDVISGLIRAELSFPDGTTRPMTDREVMFNARLVILAGGGTSWRQFGITLWALLTHRDQLEAVKADRTLVDAAIEESLRWNTTAPVFSRLVVEDGELAGTPIPKDSLLEICIGTANRDPKRWDNPDAYNLHRPFQNHIGFSVGQHRCLGMDVARSEISLGLNRLLDEFPNLRLDPDQPAPFLTGGLEQRGMSALPVLLK